jgi:hypothetical protein
LVSDIKEELGLRVFENRVLRRIFGPKRDEVTGEWRKLHNEELHNLYLSLSIIIIIKSRRMRWAGHVARMEAKKNSYMILVVKPDGRIPVGRPMRRWVKLKLKLIYDRQSVGQSVLVSGAHLELLTNFSFSLKFTSDICVFVIL